MRWLALDVGSQRVGVAVSDDAETLATPLAALPWRGPAALAAAVEGLLRRWDAGGVVVGLPTTRRGGGRGEARVAAVVAALRARLAGPVATVDERGSTQDALARLAEAGVPPRRRAGLVDGLAAQTILASWLEERRRRGGGPTTSR